MTNAKPPTRRRFSGRDLLVALMVAAATSGLVLTLAITCTSRVTGPSMGDDGRTSELAGGAARNTSALPLGSEPIAEPGVWKEVVSNFNGTDIAAGRYIWFSAVMKYKGPKNAPVTVHVRNATIRFDQGGNSYEVPVPSTTMTLDDAYDVAAATYNASTNTWEITCPFDLSGNRLLSAAVFPVTSALEGGINPVTWRGEFFCSSPDVCVEWKWGAAVYTDFTTDLGSIQVKVSDSPKGDAYANSHHAGSPENYLDFVVGGARGGGGSNFTGSYSGTKKVCDMPPPPPPAEDIPGLPGGDETPWIPGDESPDTSDGWE